MVQQEWYSDLVKTLESASEALVVAPDHPFLAEGPDIIARDGNKLIAIFVPSRKEERSPSNIVGRLMLSRLALPAHTKCVLLFRPSKMSRQIAERFGHHFHAMTEVTHRSDIERICKDRDLGPNIRQVPKEVILRLRSPLHYLQDFSLRLKPDSLGAPDAGEIQKSLSRLQFRKHRRSLNEPDPHQGVSILSKDGIMADVLAVSDKQDVWSEIVADATRFFAENCDIHSGVPYPNQTTPFTWNYARSWAIVRPSVGPVKAVPVCWVLRLGPPGIGTPGHCTIRHRIRGNR